jgi:hypothetical protein
VVNGRRPAAGKHFGNRFHPVTGQLFSPCFQTRKES